MTRLALVAALSLPLFAACGSDGGGSTSDTVSTTDSVAQDTALPGNRFADRVPEEGFAGLGGRIVDSAGNPVSDMRVAACSQQECPIIKTDADGIFYHAALPGDRARAIYAHGTHSFRNPGPTYATVVIRADPAANEVIDIGDLVVPLLEGDPVPMDPATGGAAVLADGSLTVTIPAGAWSYAIGTTAESQKVQAGRVAITDLPDYASRPWVGKEGRAIAFSVAPWEAVSSEPITISVSGVSEPVGTVFDVYQVEPFTEDIEVVAEPLKVGTATVDADHNLVSDPGGSLESLIVIILVPQQ